MAWPKFFFSSLFFFIFHRYRFSTTMEPFFCFFFMLILIKNTIFKRVISSMKPGISWVHSWPEFKKAELLQAFSDFFHSFLFLKRERTKKKQKFKSRNVAPSLEQNCDVSSFLTAIRHNLITRKLIPTTFQLVIIASGALPFLEMFVWNFLNY